MMTPKELARFELNCAESDLLLDDVWRDGQTSDDGTFARAQLWRDRKTGRSVITRDPANGEPYADAVKEMA